MGDSSTMRIGPIGSGHGEFWDEEGRSEIVQIFMWHDDRIRSIQFQYYEHGTLVLSKRHGSIAGTKFDVVSFNYPSEYLTCVSGFQRKERCSFVTSMNSITFATNIKTYGPFGQAPFSIGAQGSSDVEFRFQLGENRQFGGFCGYADPFIGSIGVYFKPISTLKIKQKPIGGPIDQEDEALTETAEGALQVKAP